MKLSESNILRHECENGRVSFYTDKQMILVFSVISSKTIQICYRNTECEPDKSYAIEGIIYGDTTYEISENEDAFIISTKELAVKVYKKGIYFEYRRDGEILTVVKEAAIEEDGKVYCVHTMSEREHFYGLGEDNDAYLGNMDRRGTTRDMITGQRINIGHVTSDIPVTFFMSTGEKYPYGLFIDNSYRMFFDMGKTSCTEYSWSAQGGDFVTYFFAGDDFTDILNEYTNITGKPSMPPLWVLGYTQCKCSYWCWDEVDEIIETLEEKHFPLDCMVFDYDWAECFHNFKWNKRFNGDSPRKIAEHKKNGIHFMVSNSGPMIRRDSDNFQSAVDAGILAHDKDGNTVTCGHYGGELMDFSNPDMKKWIQPQLKGVLDDGVESWWLDLTEPEGDPDGTQYYDGDKAKVHNPFCLLNVKLYNEITLEYNRNKRPFILTRTGTAGIQKYNVAIWSGDVFSDYKTFTAHIPEALNTTMSGIPLWTSDSGGFMSSTNNSLYNENIYKNNPASHAALYERWLQFMCFAPITRVHHAGQSSPFVFGELLTDGVAHYVRQRYRLLPYIYSYNYRTHRTGAPMMRALVYEYSGDETVYDIKDEYLFGSEILVAPVHEEKVTERAVYFPKGKWYDWDYGYCYEGGKAYTIYAPQNRIPVFVREGSIIPMTNQIYHTKDIDWKHITVKVYPFGESSFEMFTDDGESYDFERGDYTITSFSCVETEKQTILHVCRSNEFYAATDYFFEVHMNYEPYTVGNLDCYGYKKNLEKAETGYFFDKFNGILYVKITAEISEIIITHGPELRKISEYNEEENIIGQLPFILPAASVPCRIACENYDRGGQDVAYHKNNTSLRSEIYRTDHVLVELCDDVGVGYAVYKMEAGEWLEYSINVRKAGKYVFGCRVQGIGEFSLDVNSQNQTGLLKIASERWNTVYSMPIMLAEGEQVVRFFVRKGELKANYIEISEFE